jgi:putative oxidoreductase
MGFAIYLVHFSDLLQINDKTGGLVIELPLLYMLCAIALMFIGAGKYSIDKK